MQNSATPLLIGKIAAIIVLALTVHAVSAGDPSYGSATGLTIVSALD